MYVKYKYFRTLLVGFALLLSFILPTVTAYVGAEPQSAGCTGGTLTHDASGTPICTCPKGKVLVTTTTPNACQSKCPKGTIANKDSATGQSVCNAPRPKTCPDGTDAPHNDPSKCPASSNINGDCSTLGNCTLITTYINPFIKFLSALVGVAVVISIVIGGIQYGSSGGDPSKVTAAKNRIRNAIIALVTYIFLFALLNFLIPGGLV